MIDESVIIKMKESHIDFQKMPLADIKALVKRGLEIKAEDDKLLDQGTLRSHFQMSDFDKDSLHAAGRYNILAGNDPWYDADAPDEEE